MRHFDFFMRRFLFLLWIFGEFLGRRERFRWGTSQIWPGRGRFGSSSHFPATSITSRSGGQIREFFFSSFIFLLCFGKFSVEYLDASGDWASLCLIMVKV